MKKRKSENRRHEEQITNGTKRIADGTKQNKKRQKVYAVPRGSPFCKAGLGIRCNSYTLAMSMKPR
ncbi:hypothetical protein T01_9334, partial [Trichinella spiralis]